MAQAETDAITLFVEDANGTVYLAEQVGWRSDTGRVGIVKMWDEDEPIYRLVAQERGEQVEVIPTLGEVMDDLDRAGKDGD